MDEAQAQQLAQLLARWYRLTRRVGQPQDEFEALQMHWLTDAIAQLRLDQQRELGQLARKCHTHGHSEQVTREMTGYAAQVLRRRLLAIGLL